MSSHRPRKRFGQHFLHDAGILRRLLDAISPSEKDFIVEIGPGEGALTRLRPVLMTTAALVFEAPFGIRVSGAYRFQSGRPFTPGFRPGVDADAAGVPAAFGQLGGEVVERVLAVDGVQNLQAPPTEA